MRLEFIHDHHHAVSEWQERELYEWVTDVFAAPAITLRRGCTNEIRSHIASEFEGEGWALNVKIDQELRNTVFAIRDDLAFQIQTGNMSRAPYDLLKLQYLFQSKKISAAAFALPTKLASGKIGSNVAYFERLCNELQLFDRVITVPILVVGFG
ncbi:MULTISPECIES: BglII/BstYI family type II restriction endonuclease [unclassified Rhizobium]|uniref:BglII/BstYI family type II restriction endonuclease n=1 Tax=unclassified Rhizobium TaxID=2613769 RepID=UPI001C83E696|nr:MULTISPECIES: BglII/BstYI family type II restriction endonuclease [unclassified Rhizobium]